VGTGDATQALNNCYTANGWEWLEGFSTHNEFLEEAVRHGLLGLLLLLAVFLYPMIQSIRRGNYWYALQSIAFFVALMIDCYLSNQKGIVWYMWIGSLWYMLPRET
jgi:O-antigen ligase